MTDKVVEHIEEAKRLLHARKFQEGLGLINTVDLAHLSTEQKIQASLVKAELSLLLGVVPDERDIMDAMTYYKVGTDTASYALAKYLHGWSLACNGDFAEAREVLLEAYVHYKRCDDFLRQAGVLNRLCHVLFTLGDIENSIRYLRKSIELYQGYNSEDNARIVMMNLGAVYYCAGMLSSAIETYESILRNESPKGVWSEYFCHNQAMPYALKGDLARAKSILSHAQSDEPNSYRRTAVYYEYLGWIHLLEEDYPAAEKALLQGLEISMRIGPESALVSQIKRRLADACFGQGKYDAARTYADEGLVVAEKIGERVEIAACDRVFAQLEIVRGDLAAARQWFAKAIDIFSMIGSRYELAATRYLAAVSGVYQNGERQALLYLARAYFESEEVEPYLAKIDRALKRLPSPAHPVRPVGPPPVVIVESAGMRKIVELARHVAQSDMAILLTGPTGTGKDLLSEYIHYHSGRSGRFVAVNTAAIPDSMVEAELFGYRKGAFTGADRDKAGLIDQAAGGTLYLNEIADSSPEFQAKLLDVLEHRRVRALGDTDDHAVDFRLIAASNQDLAELVRQNRFRADLYHRLNQVNLTLPSLNDRREDIPALVRHFVTSCGIQPDDTSGNGDGSPLTRLTAALSAHDWPGNIRELKAEIERLALVCERDLSRMASMVAPPECDADRDHLMQLLEETNWNRSEVARLMGVTEGAIRYRIRALGLLQVKQ